MPSGKPWALTPAHACTHVHLVPGEKTCRRYTVRPTPDSTLSRGPRCYFSISIEWPGWVSCLSSAGRFDTQHHSRNVSAERKMTLLAWDAPFILSHSSSPGGSWDLAMGMEGQEYPPGKRRRQRQRDGYEHSSGYYSVTYCCSRILIEGP